MTTTLLWLCVVLLIAAGLAGTVLPALPGTALVLWAKGRHARLTPFAQRLLWAERQARTRLTPHVEALRSELARVFAHAGRTRAPLRFSELRRSQPLQPRMKRDELGVGVGMAEQPRATTSAPRG